MTMQLISTVTVGAGNAAEISFTGIPQTFTDLLLVVSLRNNNNSVVDFAGLKFNTLTTNHSSFALTGTGTAVNRDSRSSFWLPINGDTSTANIFSNSSIYIFNYTAATSKTISTDGATENQIAQAWQSIIGGLWANTAAINSLALYGAGTVFLQNSTASLYGITKGSGGATIS
jgi:hypothetical protein